MINKERPEYYPLHGTLGVNTTAPQDSDFIQASYPEGYPVPSADHNGKLGSNGKWVSYNDATQLRTQDWLDSSTTQALTATSLTYVNGGNVLTTGAVVQTRAAYLLAGGRFETDDAFLNPVGADVSASPLVFPSATVPGRIWLYANTGGELRVESVGPAVADTPGVGEMSLVGLQVDALGVVTDGSLAPITLPLPAYEVGVSAPILHTGKVSINGTGTMLDVIAGTVTGGTPGVVIDGDLGPAVSLTCKSPADATATITNTGNHCAVIVQGTCTSGAVIIDGTTGRALYCTATGAETTLRVDASGTGRGIEVLQTGTEVAVYADSSGGTNYAIEAIGPAGGTSIYATTTGGTAVQAVSTGSGAGVRALGGPNAASLAVRAEAIHDDAYGLQALTSATATSTAAAVLGSGRADGVGLYGLAVDGFGIVAQSDTTSPKRAALLLVAQDADPTTALRGSVLHNSARGPTGKLRTYTTQWESVHSSAKGRVDAWGATASGSTAGGSGNLSLAQISPEEVGDVLVHATGHLSFSIDNGSCTVALIDVTSGATVATQVETSSDPANNATNLGVVQRSFAIRGTRTLPSAVTRTFAVVITVSAGVVTYSNVICSVTGVR